MIELFYFWNDITYPVNIGIKTSHYITELVEGGFYENELRNKYHGVKWIGNGKTIILFENEVTIIAYPSLDMNYVVVVYNSNSKQYPAPNNCVVYNIDGTVHKIISTPVLKTPDENGNFKKDIILILLAGQKINRIKLFCSLGLMRENGIGFLGMKISSLIQKQENLEI